MLHGLSEFKVNETKSELLIQRPNAGASIRYLGSFPVKFRQWDGFKPQPSRPFDNQWHVEASTSKKRMRFKCLQLLRRSVERCSRITR